MSFYLAEPEGLDLLCGGGQVAALRAHRALIHSRSRSNPSSMFFARETKTESVFRRSLSFLAGMEGFEPSE